MGEVNAGCMNIKWQRKQGHILCMWLFCVQANCWGVPKTAPAPRERWLLPDLYLIITCPWSRVTQHGQERQKHQLVWHYHTANFNNHLITLPRLWLSRCRSWAQPKGRWGFRITVSAHISCCKLASFVSSALFFPPVSRSYRYGLVILATSSCQWKKNPPKCILDFFPQMFVLGTLSDWVASVSYIALRS